jgi:hypothetical protein
MQATTMQTDFIGTKLCPFLDNTLSKTKLGSVSKITARLDLDHQVQSTNRKS